MSERNAQKAIVDPLKAALDDPDAFGSSRAFRRRAEQVAGDAPAPSATPEKRIANLTASFARVGWSDALGGRRVRAYGGASRAQQPSVATFGTSSPCSK